MIAIEMDIVKFRSFTKGLKEIEQALEALGSTNHKISFRVFKPPIGSPSLCSFKVEAELEYEALLSLQFHERLVPHDFVEMSPSEFLVTLDSPVRIA